MLDLQDILDGLEVVDAFLKDGRVVTARTMILGLMAQVDAEIADQPVIMTPVDHSSPTFGQPEWREMFCWSFTDSTKKYTVRLNDYDEREDTCTCADFTFRKHPCKHIRYERGY